METVIRRLEQAAMAFAVLSILAIMLIVSIDAIARYVLHAPLPWAFEVVTYYLMAAGVYFAVSGTYRHGDHVNISIVQEMMPPRLRAICESICSLIAAVVFAVIAYGAWHGMVEAYMQREFLPGYVVWPAWLSHLPIPLGCALIVLRLLHHSFMLIRHGADPYVEVNQEVSE